MMLKFTNNSNSNRKGDPVYISKDWIVSVFEESVEGGSLATIIYGGPRGERWYVEEGLSEVVKIIDGAK